MSEVTNNGDHYIVQPSENITAATATELKQELKDILDSGANNLTLDLAKVELLDSMGLSVLLSAHNSLKEKGNKLELINLDTNIKTLICQMRLDQHFVLS